MNIGQKIKYFVPFGPWTGHTTQPTIHHTPTLCDKPSSRPIRLFDTLYFFDNAALSRDFDVLFCQAIKAIIGHKSSLVPSLYVSPCIYPSRLRFWTARPDLCCVHSRMYCVTATFPKL